MSATFLDQALAVGERPPERAASTNDLDSTTDLQGDSTTDLAPVTTDIEPAAILGTPAFDRADANEPAALPAEASQQGNPARSATHENSGLARLRAAAARPLAPGAVLCDRYILEKALGSGGTAVVYQARDMASGSATAPNIRLALKTPRVEGSDRARASSRLRHEFEHAQKLSHANIVRVFELHADTEPCFMTMELIEGRLLSTIVRDWTMLPRPLANKILRACAQALAHAHAHDVIHGDFKPGNVFLTHGEEVKIVDFGAAAALSGGSSRIPAGTPAYASPQVLSGETPDRRDDIFSFACFAYELLTGQHPFEHRSSLEAREQSKAPARAWSLSSTQWLALLSALSWDREQRPSDIEALLTALVSQPEPIAQTPPIQPTTHAVATELLPELMPPQRGWGFFIFIACAIAVTFIAMQREGAPEQVADAPAVQSAAAAVAATLPPLTNSVVGSMERAREPLPGIAKAEKFATTSAATNATPAAAAATPLKPATPAAPLGEISFDAPSIVTTEGSVAAVFLIKRSQPLRGRVRVQWSAASGTADAGIDFASNAAGSVEFADGQAQRAIYVPLRNDLLKENDETFTVRLLSPQNARLSSASRSEATIRDDD